MKANEYVRFKRADGCRVLLTSYRGEGFWVGDTFKGGVRENGMIVHEDAVMSEVDWAGKFHDGVIPPDEKCTYRCAFGVAEAHGVLAVVGIKPKTMTKG